MVCSLGLHILIGGNKALRLFLHRILTDLYPQPQRFLTVFQALSSADIVYVGVKSSLALMPPFISSSDAVPALFGAAALFPALMAAAQPQRTPPSAGPAPHTANRHVQAVQHTGPTQKKGDLQLLLHRLHHHQWQLPAARRHLQRGQFHGT